MSHSGLSLILVVVCLAAICQAGNVSSDDLSRSVSSKKDQSPIRAKFTLNKLFDFERFAKVFNKHYSVVEGVARAKLYLARAFRSFVSSVSYKHRKASSYLAINHMSDWTPEEVREIDVAPEILMDMLDTSAQDNTEQQEGSEPLPAASLDEVKRTLYEISRNGREQPAMRLIVEELNGPHPHRERRDASGSTASKRDISLDDLARDPSNEIVDTSQRVPSNNPHYEPPELISFGSSDDIPRSVLPWRDANYIINLPGRDFLNSVVKKANDVLSSDDETESMALPDEVFIDHRDECMFAPRGQGKCGCCYAFAAVTVYEWLYCKATGKRVAFSEQYMVDCGQQSGLRGCKGGFLSKVPNFILEHGMELRANYPYREKEDQCPYDDSTPTRNRGYLRISINRLEAINESDFETHLKTSPMVVALYVSDAFHEYGGGVHDGAGCDVKRAHAVVLVGSGREDNQDYWLFRNSYSPTYGEAGYYKMNKQAKNCISNQQAFLYSGITGVDKEQGINNLYQSRAVKRRYQDYLSMDVTLIEEQR